MKDLHIKTPEILAKELRKRGEYTGTDEFGGKRRVMYRMDGARWCITVVQGQVVQVQKLS